MALLDMKDSIASLGRTFNNAKPFKYLVIDNFLEPQLAEAVLSDFPLPEEMDQHGGNQKVLRGWQISPQSENYSSKPALSTFLIS